MKNLIMLLILFPIAVNSQYFSGEITYEINILPKADTIDIKEIIDLKHGTKAKYLIKSKKYKSIYFKNNKYNYSYTYEDDTKRMFDDYSDKPYITFRNSQKANYEYYGSEIFKDSIATVFGKDCYMVLTKSEYGTSRTYYSDDIRVNHEDFTGHKVGNWYAKLKEVNGAIALKTITEHDTYFEIQEAVDIVERNVADSEFELPNKPIAASFSALDNRVEMIEPTRDQIQCYQQKVYNASEKEGEKYLSYVSFLLQTDGTIKFIEPYEKDESGFYKVAVEIISTCGFKFQPGLINGNQVDSQVYFPIEFTK
ncbi:hypothetical protein [Allomuricauda sp. NBRC 101325]|uniref:hypothetical protein n=1 Tax=Allomuricauda sp. NBRC 101325 TaxID=1113758 RepID=UPI0024A569AD|nr:hypothetical protein [Muricauda sp. NBRC 101325]GLU44846.1 hypothetical protein Musp01_24700 [Muricauda sp. NBRC 101325]